VAALIRFRLLIPVLALALCVSPSAAAPEGDSAEKVYQRALKSTVWVLVRRGERDGAVQFASGSGSVIDVARKRVLTNEHVVGSSETATVLFPVFQKGKLVAERDFYLKQLGKSGIRGKVVAKDIKRDLAVIELEALPEGVKSIELAPSSPGPGQRVHSVGNPGKSGALWVYTSGTVRQVYHKKWRSADDRGTTERDAQVIETSSPTNHGDSGGPLLNEKGQLVAVTQGGAADAQLLSFFIDVSEVRGLLKQKKMLPRNTPPEVASGGGSDKPKTGDTPTKVVVEDADRVEKVANAKLTLARALADDGVAKADEVLVKKACDRCETIIKDYPNTKAAAEAKKLLEKLKK